MSFLRPPRTGDDEVPPRCRMVNDLWDHVPPEPGGAPHVLEHQQPGPEHEAESGPIEPDGRPNEPSDPEKRSTDTSDRIPVLGDQRIVCSRRRTFGAPPVAPEGCPPDTDVGASCAAPRSRIGVRPSPVCLDSPGTYLGQTGLDCRRLGCGGHRAGCAARLRDIDGWRSPCASSE